MGPACNDHGRPNGHSYLWNAIEFAMDRGLDTAVCHMRFLNGAHGRPPPEGPAYHAVFGKRVTGMAARTNNSCTGVRQVSSAVYLPSTDDHQTGTHSLHTELVSTEDMRHPIRLEEFVDHAPPEGVTCASVRIRGLVIAPY